MAESSLQGMIEKCAFDGPLNEALHKKALSYLKTYALVGGMPAVVKEYRQSRDLNAVNELLNDLLETFIDDFRKYQGRYARERLTNVFRSVATQTGGKFVYSQVDRAAKSTSIAGALELLEMAGLVHKAFHTDAGGIPLGAQINRGRFKVFLFDIGLHQRLMGLDIGQYILKPDLMQINRGSLAELLAALALVGAQSARLRPELYYWQSNAAGSTAEVDFIVQHQGLVLPLEIKSGVSGGMKSMHVFLNARKLPIGLRSSLESFGQTGNIRIIPLYALNHLYDLL